MTSPEPLPPLPPATPPGPPPRRSAAVPLALGIGLVLLAVIAIRRAVAPRPAEDPTATAAAERGRKLPEYGEIADFELVDQYGKTVTRRDLAGRIWVLDFFFTSCAGPCIDLTAKMRALSLALLDEPDVGLISVSVDPQTDTPEALRRYARVVGGESERWLWLTGDPAQVKRLAASFFAALGEKDATGDITHSTRLHVIDRNGWLRAIHDTQLPDEWKPATLHSVELLLTQQRDS